MIINKKIKRTMLENKSQYLGSLVLIILSCLLFTMLNLLSVNMSRLFSDFSENYTQEDADFMTDVPINNISEIEETYHLRMEEAKTYDYAVSQDKVLRIFSENSKVNIPAIIEGSKLSGNDVLIDPAYAKANQLKVNDSIQIYDKAYRIAGYMSLPNYIYPLKSNSDIMSDPNTFGIAVISKGDFDTLMQGNTFYQIRFNDSKDIETQISQLKKYIYSKNINIISWVNTSVNPRVTMVATKLKGIDSISSFMPIAILLLTCILTGIVMWRMVKKEAAIIGTLYALGYRKKEIQNHYLRYPVVIAFIGGVIGTILGSMLLMPMLDLMVSYFNTPVDEIHFNIIYVVISLLLPLIFLISAGYLVVRKALKSSPLELMRGGKDTNKVGFIEKNLKLDRFKFPTKFKIREQFRSVARSSFLLLGIVLATMLLLMGVTAKSSLDSLIKNGFEETYQYNYSYVFNTIQNGSPEQGEAFSEVPFSLSSNEDISIILYGINPNSEFISLEDKSGHILSTNQVIITKGLADKLKIKSGETITITSKLSSKEYDIKIDQIAESYVGNYIYMPLNDLNSILNYPSGSYMGIWSNNKLDLPESSLLTTVSKDDIKNAFNAMTAPIQSIVGITAFMSFLIGLIVIYVVTSLIVEENKENISLMKILGYRKKEVYSMILNSSSFSVILGYVIGVPVLFTSLGALYQSLTKELSFSLPIEVNYIFLAIGFAVIYLTYEISKAISKRKVNRISMNEVLKSRLE
jgi:putative ABC transport system permease protein